MLVSERSLVLLGVTAVFQVELSTGHGCVPTAGDGDLEHTSSPVQADPKTLQMPLPFDGVLSTPLRLASGDEKLRVTFHRDISTFSFQSSLNFGKCTQRF